MKIILDTNSKAFQKAFIISTLAFSLLCFTIAFAWTGPTGSPPNSNVSAPVNVGTDSQVKNGALSVNGLSVYGDQYIDGNIGVGAAPSASYKVYVLGSSGIAAETNSQPAIRGINTSGNWSGYFSGGPVYSEKYMRADGGFCIGGSCKTSWTPSVTTGTCSAYGSYQAECRAACPSGYQVVGGGCRTSGSEWYIWQTYPSGDGWYCAAQEDWGSSQYNQYVYGYARCIR